MKETWRSSAAQAILKRSSCSQMRGAIRVIVGEVLKDGTVGPTDLSAVAKTLGVCVRPGEISGSGEFRRSADGLEIIYSSDQSKPRQRFTIAHELGHLLIAKIHPRANQRAKEVERLCDLIAAELLMPTDVFRKDIKQPVTHSRIYSLARLLSDFPDRDSSSLR